MKVFLLFSPSYGNKLSILNNAIHLQTRVVLFYIWLKRSIQTVTFELFSLRAVPPKLVGVVESVFWVLVVEQYKGVNVSQHC